MSFVILQVRASFCALLVCKLRPHALATVADDGRDAISEDLKYFKHPLDCRRKDKGQEKREKWFTGERMVSLCNGGRGSPGGPKVFARVLLTLADELLAGATAAKQAPAPAPAPVAQPQAAVQRGSGGLATGFQGFGARPGAAPASTPTPAPAPEEETLASLRVAAKAKTDEGRRARLRLHARVTAAPARTQTVMESEADQDALAVIRGHYGAIAQIIINNILGVDAYLRLYFLWRDRKCKFRDTHPNKLRFALENCRHALNYQEMLERVTIAAHKSWYPHLFAIKMSLHILMYGDLTALSITSLELLKRAAKTNSTSRIELSDESAKQRAEREAAGSDEEDEAAERVQLQPRAYSTTMSHQVATYVTAQQMLRKDESAIRHRRAERLFGEMGSGRFSLVKKQKTEVAVALAAEEEEQRRVLARFVATLGRWDDTQIKPHDDTVLRAFARALKLRATASAN